MPSGVPLAAVARCSRGSALSRPRTSLELWPRAPAASRHLPCLPCFPGLCVYISCPQRKNIELGTELPRGSPRAPGQGKRLGLFEPPVPHGQDGETDAGRVGTRAGNLTLLRMLHGQFPEGRDLVPFHAMVSNERHRSLLTAIPDRRLPNSLFPKLISDGEKGPSYFQAGGLTWNSGQASVTAAGARWETS